MKPRPDCTRSIPTCDFSAIKATTLALSLAACTGAIAHPAGHAEASEGATRPFVTANIAGQLIAIDRQTGKSRPLTGAEAQRVAAALRQMLNQSTEGLVQVRRPDGTILMDLQDRFQNVVLAKREDDGSISQACVDNVDNAAAFFEIDPALLGSVQKRLGRPSSTKLETE